MKKILILSAAVLLLPLLNAGASDLTLDASMGAYSSYMWRGYRLSPEALQLQPSVTVSGSGFSANVWADYDTDSNDVLEVDYTASYAFDVDAVSLEAGFIHYDVRGGLDSDEVYMGASLGGFLNPSLTAYYDIDAGDGAFLVAGISHPLSLSDRASLDLGASVSFNIDDDYVAVKPNGDSYTGLFNGELSAGASVKLSEKVTLEPMVGYTFALSDTASDAIKAGSTSYDDSFFYGALSLAVSF